MEISQNFTTELQYSIHFCRQPFSTFKE